MGLTSDEWDELLAPTVATEVSITKMYKKALVNIKSQIADYFEKYAGADGKLSASDLAKYDRLVALEKSIESTLTKGVIRPTTAALTGLSQEQFKVAYAYSGYKFNEANELLLSFDIENSLSLLASKLVGANYWQLVSERALRDFTADSLNKLFRAITDGLQDGMSYPHMAASIQEALEISAGRAIRIARTEGQRAAVLGQRAMYDSARAQGVNVALIWDAADDSRTRSFDNGAEYDHTIMDGVEAEEISGEMMFDTGENGLGYVLAPMIGPAGWVINCRCRIREEVRSAPKELQDDSGELPNLTDWMRDYGFDDWMKP